MISVILLLAMVATWPQTPAKPEPDYVCHGYPGFGSIVSKAGDVNGDGVPDVIVGDPGRSSDGIAPRLWILSGKDGTALRSVELPAGNARNGWLEGPHIEGGEDVDGDRVPDILVPSIAQTSPGLAELYFFSGKTGKVLRHNSTRKYGSGSIAEVHWIPDFDHDGIADVGVLNCVTSEKHGTLAVYSGKTGECLKEISVENERESTYGAFAACGDLDSDGMIDFAVLFDVVSMNQDARSRDKSVSESDRKCRTSLRVYSARDQRKLWERLWEAKEHVSQRVALARIDGVGSSPRLVAGVDEQVDVVEGASGNVVFHLHADHDEMSGFGCAIAAPGDLNGDQVPDFVFSIFDTGIYDGRVEAISGKDGKRLWRFESSLEDDDIHHLGTELAVLGDLDGDGVNDLAVAAEMRINGTAGVAEVRSGKSGALLFRFKRIGDEVVVTKRAAKAPTPR